METKTSLIHRLKKRSKLLVGISFTTAVLLNIYLFANYEVGNVEFNKITIETNLNQYEVLVYTNSLHQFGINYNQHLQAKPDSNRLKFDITDEGVRKFRIYIGHAQDSLFINNISLHSNGHIEKLPLSKFTFQGIKAYKINNEYELSFSNDINAFLELKKQRVFIYEFILVEILMLILSLLMGVVSLITFMDFSLEVFKPIGLKKIGVIVFLMSVFLPQPLFNIAFISSFVFIVMDFDWRLFTTNKLGLLIVSFFIYFFVNNLIFANPFNRNLTETYLPILLIPFYFSSVPKSDYLRVFPMSAILLGLYFFASSSIDAFLYSNINYFSFDAFTKYVHPVYFSYLLFFSIVYIESIKPLFMNRSAALFILIASLLFCGSKLIISLTAVFYLIRFFKKRVVLGLLSLATIVIAIGVFPPTQKRFKEVFDVSKVSILNDRPIKSIHDERLNGLTLRLILWQESLTASKNFSEITFGKGVGKEADDFLKNKLSERGLEGGHTNYDPHNQFIATYYKLGVLGLLLLLATCIYALFLAIRTKNTVFVYVVILFLMAMFTESVLQRVVGINFFISILLLFSISTNSKYNNFENSHTRD